MTWNSGAPEELAVSAPTGGTRIVPLFTDLVISHVWGKDREVFTSGIYSWYYVTQIFRNGYPSYRSYFNLAIRNPWLNSFFVGSNPLSNPDRNHKLWNIG